jgi:diguanylate cyclase (GGDEF)-like protein/PAS domain S-box-containing protein
MLVCSGPKHRVEEINPRAEKLLDMEPGQARGAPINELLVRAGDAERFAKDLEEDGVVHDFEALLKGRGDREFWALVSAQRIVLDGEPALVVTLDDVSSRKELEQELRHAAEYDALTGLHSRRHFYQVMDRELERARRYEHTTCVMMIDLDRFKEINDTCGHQEGDRYLRQFADSTRELLRRTDVIGRVGGEEFAVLLPETEFDQAREIAERLRHHIENLDTGCQGRHIGTTASIGLVILDPYENIHSALDRADRAMYEAKRAGRNAVHIA